MSEKTHDQQKGIIYIVTGPSGKFYIGQTRNFINRKRQHEKCKKPYKLANAIQKYGKDAFTWDILCDMIPLRIIDRVECLYIHAYRSTQKDRGYNILPGGKCSPHTAETLEKMRGPRPYFTWDKNGNSTVYTISDPRGNIYHFSGQKEIKTFFNAINKLLDRDGNKRIAWTMTKRKIKESFGWKVIAAEKINIK